MTIHQLLYSVGRLLLRTLTRDSPEKCPDGHRVDISSAKWTSQKNPYTPYPKSPGAMSVKREKWPWKATVIVSVGPLRCLATIRSASPARGLSFS